MKRPFDESFLCSGPDHKWDTIHDQPKSHVKLVILHDNLDFVNDRPFHQQPLKVVVLLRDHFAYSFSGMIQ